MSFNCNQWYLNGLKKTGAANTLIGGVASVINTPALLAAKLQNYPSGTAFDSSNIQNFTIVGSDIECYIGVDYSANFNGLFDVGIRIVTYFSDYGNFCKKLNVFYQINLEYFNADGILKLEQRNFANCYKLKIALLPSCVSSSLDPDFSCDYFNGSTLLEAIYLPNCLNFGQTVGSQNAFRNINATKKIYVHPSMATINSGGVEGDLVGHTVSYVSNSTDPNPITDLTIGNVYATALQLNFTAPTGGANVIDFYEVYSGNKYLGKITASGQYITGLTPNTVYNIEIKPVDIYYNKSTSNIVTQLTSSGAITDLSVGTVYATAVQVLFTAPSNIYNPNGKYRCYADGVYKNTINIGGYITGLTPNTSYNITVIAEDGINGIGGITSNIVTQATAATYYVDTASLVSYYKMENNVLDSWGANNGVATSITYTSGLVGQVAVFNGSAKINIPNSAAFQTNNGTIAFNVKSGNGTSYRALVVKTQAYGLFLLDGILQLYNYSGATGFKSTGINLNDGLNHIIVFTFQNGVINGTKIYLDNVLVLTTTTAIANQTGGIEIGANTGVHLFNGQIDEAAFFNSILTAGEASEITAKLNSGQSLI